jgi:competence protein ComEC
VGPQYGIFSRGCDNSYGHPAPEIVARFASFGIPTFDTCTQGTVTFVSDGQAIAAK